MSSNGAGLLYSWLESHKRLFSHKREVISLHDVKIERYLRVRPIDYKNKNMFTKFLETERKGI